MLAEFNETIFLGANDSQENPALLVAAVLHLMSHYTAVDATAEANIKLASVIERHLKILANLPDLAPVLSTTCQQLSARRCRQLRKNRPRLANAIRRRGRAASSSTIRPPP